MAAKGQSNAEKFSRWDVLITNGRASLAEMPHLTEDLTQMEGKLLEVRTLESRQEDLRSQAQEINVKIRELAREGEKIRSRIGANLRGKFGFTSEALVRFGFKPLRVVRRRAVAKPEEPTQAPTQQVKPV
jgi:hypothetical protein